MNEFKQEDIRIDTFSGDPKLYPRVRLVHMPTGLVFEINTGTSRHRNMKIAMKKLQELFDNHHDK